MIAIEFSMNKVDYKNASTCVAVQPRIARSTTHVVHVQTAAK